MKDSYHGKLDPKSAAFVANAVKGDTLVLTALSTNHECTKMAQPVFGGSAASAGGRKSVLLGGERRQRSRQRWGKCSISAA